MSEAESYTVFRRNTENRSAESDHRLIQLSSDVTCCTYEFRHLDKVYRLTYTETESVQVLKHKTY